MPRVAKIEIKETVTELQKLLKRQKTATGKDKKYLIAAQDREKRIRYWGQDESRVG